jgi:uptake hydrogenase large subunit
MTRRIIGPFNRVEGDLEVCIDIKDGAISDARITSTLYRGFEQILEGKDPRDALIYAPRICGICSVSQSVAAAYALNDIQKITVPDNGQLATKLISATENVADHLTHFYMFFMPDFARETYRAKPWFEHIEKRFKATKGTALAEILPARAEFLNILGILAGKWPHSLAIQPGGTTKSIEVQEKTRLLTLIASFRRTLEKALFGTSLEHIAQLSSNMNLMTWAENDTAESSDFRNFLNVAEELNLCQLGKSESCFLSYGAYPTDGIGAFSRGVYEKGAVSEFDPACIEEDSSHTWMAHRNKARHPFDGITVPDADAENAYSWSKAPRLNGATAEVGALARQLVDGHPLARDLGHGNVRSRVICRMLEIARILPMMEEWVQALKPGEPCCITTEMPDDAQGYGLVEAARGSLGHWVKVRDGRIQNYQIIAPTTWNFSPRDMHQVPGALEQALIGNLVDEDEKDPVVVQHIVRSFDPCMVCTVH